MEELDCLQMCLVDGCVMLRLLGTGFCRKHKCSYRNCPSGGPEVNHLQHGKMACYKCRIKTERYRNSKKPLAFEEFISYMKVKSPRLFQKLLKPLLPRSPAYWRKYFSTDQKRALTQLQEVGFFILQNSILLPSHNKDLNAALDLMKCEENIFEYFCLDKRELSTDLGYYNQCMICFLFF